jgi:hypothetical protein
MIYSSGFFDALGRAQTIGEVILCRSLTELSHNMEIRAEWSEELMEHSRKTNGCAEGDEK